MHTTCKKGVLFFLIIGLFLTACSSDENHLKNTTRPAGPVLIQSVQIGTQRWTANNCTHSQYRDGTVIPQVTNLTQWGNLTSGAWCYYANSTANGMIYGKLYNWYALAGIYDETSLNNPSLRKQFTPIGWHVPSDAEWNTLVAYLGGTSVAGGKMKVAGTSYWNSPNTGATNSSGFAGLGGGFRTGIGSFASLGYGCDWWSSTESDEFNAWSSYLLYNFSQANRSAMDKASGFYVRLIKD